MPKKVNKPSEGSKQWDRTASLRKGSSKLSDGTASRIIKKAAASGTAGESRVGIRTRSPTQQLQPSKRQGSSKQVTRKVSTVLPRKASKPSDRTASPSKLAAASGSTNESRVGTRTRSTTQPQPNNCQGSSMKTGKVTLELNKTLAVVVKRMKVQYKYIKYSSDEDSDHETKDEPQPHRNLRNKADPQVVSNHSNNSDGQQDGTPQPRGRPASVAGGLGKRKNSESAEDPKQKGRRESIIHKMQIRERKSLSLPTKLVNKGAKISKRGGSARDVKKNSKKR